MNTVNGQIDRAGLQKLGLSTSSGSNLSVNRLGGAQWTRQFGSSSTLNGVDSVFGQSWNKHQGNINSGSLGSFGLSNSRTGGSQAISSASGLGLTSSQATSLNGNSFASSSLASTNFGCNEFGDEQGAYYRKKIKRGFLFLLHLLLLYLLLLMICVL